MLGSCGGAGNPIMLHGPHSFPTCRDVNLSESEAEQDGAHNILELPQAYAGRGNMKAQQSAVRLTEVGREGEIRAICMASCDKQNS